MDLNSLVTTGIEIDDEKTCISHRFLNEGGEECIIVAAIFNKTTNTWKAYIGCDRTKGISIPEDFTKDLKRIAAEGHKLLEREALGFFPQFHALNYKNR